MEFLFRALRARMPSILELIIVRAVEILPSDALFVKLLLRDYSRSVICANMVVTLIIWSIGFRTIHFAQRDVDANADSPRCYTQNQKLETKIWPWLFLKNFFTDLVSQLLILA